MKLTTCCFIGHRAINETEDLKIRLTQTIVKLITNEKVDTFFFGSKSRFNDLCLEIVTKLKEKYPHIKRIYVRAEYPYIDENYRAYLMNFYEEIYYPEKLSDAGRAVYVERNQEMITRSRFCIVYYHEKNSPTARKSGTKTALDYAVRQKKEIIYFP